MLQVVVSFEVLPALTWSCNEPLMLGYHCRALALLDCCIVA